MNMKITKIGGANLLNLSFFSPSRFWYDFANLLVFPFLYSIDKSRDSQGIGGLEFYQFLSGGLALKIIIIIMTYFIGFMKLMGSLETLVIPVVAEWFYF